MSASNRRSRPPLILIASDQEWSARSLESVLGPHGYAALRATTSHRALELARITEPDAIIIDMGLPDIGGRAVCEQLRQDARMPLNVPIILTTSAVASRSERLDAYAAGAWELCAEPFDVEVLLLKLDAFVQAKLAADRVREETLVDEETGLYNARGLARRAREIGGEAIRRSDALACVAFSALGDSDAAAAAADADHEIAETISRICQCSARLSDAVGRIGPNEYAIIAPGAGEDGAERIVARLRDSLESVPVRIQEHDHRFRLAASVAAVSNLAESAVDAMELLYRATTSLRQVRNDSQPPSVASVVRH
ncbi:MAG TPA: response regulator [Gemmatimonadaceae bacterium]|nr:response regulator [Gemmatimonadaceae bacterium]